MPAIMHSGRELRRVPLDFDWPLHKTWSGYVNPYTFPDCPSCQGTGYAPATYAIAQTFYPHMIGGLNAERLAWCDKIGQEEVDMLVSEHRLGVWRDGHWTHPPRSAAEINAANKRGGNGLLGHDAINRGLLVEFRCRLLGIPLWCDDCLGNGCIAGDDDLKAQDEWESIDPPTGEAYQLWETVSEGSPITPVFATLDALLDWLDEHEQGIAGSTLSREEWARLLAGDAM